MVMLTGWCSSPKGELLLSLCIKQLPTLCEELQHISLLQLCMAVCFTRRLELA